MTSQTKHATRMGGMNRSRRGLVAALAMILLVGGCGGDQQSGFLFQFRDLRDQPVAEVRMFYLADGDTVSVGRTDSKGNLLIDHRHLDPLPREFGFLLPTTFGEAVPTFDPDRCEMIHTATRETYRVDPDAGIVTPSDLEAIPEGWRHAGRLVTLELAAPASRREPEVVYTIPMTISTLIRTAPGARVLIDDIVVGETDPDGELVVSFCWWREENGDYVPRSEIEIRIDKPGYQSRQGSVRIPDDGKLDGLEWPLDRIPDRIPARTEPVEPDEPSAVLVNLRVQHHAPFVRSCGDDHNKLPILHVNDEATVIPHLETDAMGIRVWFDLIVQAGQDYCLAVACDDGADATTWYPWDASANEPRWFRFHVPVDARQLVLVVPDGVDPSQPLQPERVANLPDFDKASCRTIRQQCRR